MSKKRVKYERELDHGPPLTQRQKAELAVREAAAADDIDYGDIPPLSDDFWKHAVRNPLYRPTKSSTTVRIDTDVLLWLKARGGAIRHASTPSCAKRCSRSCTSLEDPEEPVVIPNPNLPAAFAETPSDGALLTPSQRLAALPEEAVWLANFVSPGRSGPTRPPCKASSPFTISAPRTSCGRSAPVT